MKRIPSLIPTLIGAVLLAALPLTAAAQPGPPCTLLGMLGVPCPPNNPGAGPPVADTPPNSAASALVSHSPVVWLEPPVGAAFLDPVPGGTSTMHRNRHGISASMTTAGLDPDTVYTFWWIVFNNPEYCATTPCGPDDLGNPDVNGGVFGGNGQVSDAYGRVHLQAHVFKGEDPGLERPFADFGLAAGLLDPFKAEIHLLNRTHGPAADLTPEQREAAFNTFAGGCADFDAGPAECFDPQAAVHLP